MRIETQLNEGDREAHVEVVGAVDSSGNAGVSVAVAGGQRGGSAVSWDALHL